MDTKSVVWSALVAASLHGGIAHAQSTDVTAHLRHGIELRRAGQDEQARGEFLQAYNVAHSPVAAAQLGFAEQALGQWVDAEAHVREARQRRRMGAA